MASVEPGASPAIWRRVAAVASRLRYMVTPVETTTAGWSGSKPAAASWAHQSAADLEIDGHQAQPVGDAVAELVEAPTLPGLGTRLIDLEHPESGGELGPALGEGVEARAQDHVLGDAEVGPLGDQILDETGPSHDGSAEPTRAVRVHVRAGAPAIVGRRQLQTDLVVEHVGRRVEHDVHRAPEGDAHGSAVRHFGLLDSHAAILAVRRSAARCRQCRTTRSLC